MTTVGLLGYDRHEPEAYGGSDTFRTGDVEAAADSLCKAARGGETESRSLAAWFGGEEGFTGAREYFRWHSPARIGD